jgi:hypothetical protein
MSAYGDARAEAWYVYAVLPDAGHAMPDAAAILAGSAVGTIKEAGVTALVSLVPRALFAADHPQSKAADPAWVAVCAEAHHRVVQLATEAGPCLPLGFGTLFGSVDSLRCWLAENAGKMQRTLAQVGGQREWALTLTEDAPRHLAWLEANDPALRQLAATTKAASPGTGFLLERRLARERESARKHHGAAVAARLSECLAAEAVLVRQEPAQEGAAWSVLAAKEIGFADRIAKLAPSLFDGTGLSLRVTGPWPPYAFARAAWQEQSHG